MSTQVIRDTPQLRFQSSPNSLKPQASLVISTYNQLRHLELVLAGVGRQTFLNFEVIICDDGSSPDALRMIQDFNSRNGFNLSYFWQENKGFRKCRILNQALKIAKGETLIFLDGDCIPDDHFVEDHVQNQKENHYLAGRRVELGEEFSRHLTPERVSSGFLNFPCFPLIKSILQKDSEFLQRTYRIKNPLLRKVLKMDKVVDLKGCNYSAPRELLLKLNGFDEDYEGYGREDTDMELRFQHEGYRIKSIKGLALQYHVWHERRSFVSRNDSLLEQNIRNHKTWCTNGLVKSQKPLLLAEIHQILDKERIFLEA